ncbi:uncharacterized protein BDZ99DRAFT_466617 [Mytilinidion resinicola]|uniref:Uncharacterized protein n=1 Tax=Mytilinidion resinicola TaxID=574789 RepID=A0A6A6YAM4_9PEZI|nr:uncharacterized protein BDZ99DRAFT_466617 [Mytilinidion resinicola]KAF2805669.1 hypothetical protein BDZ99DRAFT_466617 [Mytilinidion resinicola]
MATPPKLTLLNIPLEVRHEIYGHVCERDDGPKNLLRDWFGKRELKELANAGQSLPASNLLVEDGEDNNEAEEDEEDDGEEEDKEEDEDMEEAEPEDGDGADGDGNATAAADATATATTTAPARPKISRKWRHVPAIISLTACPPTVSMLQSCQQLHDEATDFYYNTVVLRINCTASFGHMAYFEGLMNILAETAFSPAESFRKIELTFVWDSQWLAASPDYASIFVALLRERARLVAKVLERTPALKDLTILWYDSVQDDESFMLRESVIEEFYPLLDRVEMKINDHYPLKEGEEPGEETVLGKMRLQLEDVAQNFAAGQAF